MLASLKRGKRSGPPPFPISDHFDGEHFFNAGVSTDRTLSDFLRWWRTNERTAWPARVENERFDPPPAGIRSDEVLATFVGQATFLVQVRGLNILTDPVFSDCAGPDGRWGPRRARAPGLALDSLPPIDLVLLSHNHYDHMDIPSLRRLRDRSDPLILTGLGNRDYLARRGLTHCVEMDWWDAREVGEARVHFVPAQHWSSRSPFDRRKTLWGGFTVELPWTRLYFAGDTAYAAPIFREVRERLGPPDLALLPIGAYEPRWFMAAQHMNPEDAVRAHLELRSDFSIAMHFGTFRLTDEGIDAPATALAAARERYGVPADSFRVPGFGEGVRWTRRQARRAAAQG